VRLPSRRLCGRPATWKHQLFSGVGHRRSVGGTLVLPAEGAVVDLVRGTRRVGSLVVVPTEDRPILRTTRLGVAAVAHALAIAR